MAFHHVLAFVPLLFTEVVFLQTEVFSVTFSLKFVSFHAGCLFLFMPVAIKGLRCFNVVGKEP